MKDVKKFRIVERTSYHGIKTYVIQKHRRFLYWSWWEDAWYSSWGAARCIDTFNSLEDARKHLAYFDKSLRKPDIVVE